MVGLTENYCMTFFTQAAHTPVPSLERLKPFDVVDDDDDGLDKNLWVVVEKGSLCSSADCVYRDSVSCTKWWFFSGHLLEYSGA